MRWIALLAVTACTSSEPGALTIEGGAMPLGRDLTQRYTVSQLHCETGYDGDGCAPGAPEQLGISVETGSAVQLGPIDATGFDLIGVAEGTARIAVTGDGGITQELDVEVVPTDATTLFADRTPATGLGLTDVPGPAVQAFANARLAIGQHSVAADHSPLAGRATLQLANETAQLAYLASCDCFTTGAALGTARLTAPRGALEIDVVDAAAIHDVRLQDTDVFSITIGKGAAPIPTFLTPRDAAGRDIVGPGPTPTLAFENPAIATADFDETATVGRVLRVRGIDIGTTSIAVTWGVAQLTLVVSVVP